MNLLSTIGRGIKGAGRGILSGIDNAAVNSLTGGGLMDAALGSNGQPFTPTDQQRKGLRGQYLMGIGSALQQGRPIAEGIQQYQQNAIGQIQAGQQAQRQAAQRDAMARLQNQLSGAKTPQEFQTALMWALPILGPEGVKQVAEAYKAGAPAPPNKLEFRDLGDKIQAFDPVTGAPVGTPTQKALAPSENYVDQGNQIQRMLSGVPSGAPLPKSMTPGETASDVRGKFSSPVNIPGVGLMSIDPTIPNQATPITGPNGKPLVSQVGNGEGSNRGFTNTAELRRESNTLLQPFSVMAQALSKIESAAKVPSAAGDIGLLYGFMKLQDPSSTVREGEFATAQNAGSIPDAVRSAYNRAISGERLADRVRNDFLNTARTQAKSAMEQSRGIQDRYSAIARQNGLDPSQIVYDPFGQTQQPGKKYNPKTGRFEN